MYVKGYPLYVLFDGCIFFCINVYNKNNNKIKV